MTTETVGSVPGRQEGRTLVRARILGRFEVAVDGRRLTRGDWQRSSAERLFKLLLVAPGHTMSREMAAETLWPESDPELCRANLRKAIHFAHRALQPSDVLVGDGHALALDGGILDVDLDRLQAAFDEEGWRARVADDHRAAPGADGHETGARSLETILELGELTLLPDDEYEDWLAGPRERLRDRWEAIALVAAERARANGQMARAHEIVDRLLARDPTDEAAHRLAIQLYAAEGRHHAARRQFELCRAALREGLDAEPSAETAEVFHAAERQAPLERRHAVPPRLVARRAELERLESLLDSVAEGHPASAVIRGPAGIGKSRLLGEVVSLARAAEWQVVEWQAVESTKSLAYAPLRVGLGRLLTPSRLAAMDEPARSGLGTILPGLDVAPAITFGDRSALVAALVAGVAALASDRPLCFALDDIAWLDAATLEGIAVELGGFDAPVLIVGTLRDDEASPAEVEALLEAVRRTGGLELPLGPLSAGDVESLIVAHLGGQSVDPELVRLVFDQSEGNPLFCLELVRAAADAGATRLDSDRWVVADRSTLPAMPDSVRRLVARRARNLPPGAQEVIVTAAELGPEVGFETLARSLPEVAGGLIPALDAALASGLLVERGHGYAFAHPLYRLAVGGAMGLARRGSVRLRIARALVGACVGPEASPEELEDAAAAASDPVSVAEHALTAWEHGAIDAQPLAVAFAFAAGRRERKLFNLRVAGRLLERGLAAWRPLPPDVRTRFNAAPALLDLGEVMALAGRDAEAEALSREAADNARNPRQLSPCYHALWEIPYRHGDFNAALAVMQEGLARLPEDATIERANLRRDYAWALVRLRRLPEALAPTEEAAAVLEDSEDSRGAARAIDQLAMVLNYLGRRDRWVELHERALGRAIESRDSDTELIVRIHLAVALTRTGFATRAKPVLERARQLAVAMGHLYGQALEAWGSAEVEDDLGNYAAAAEHRRRELALIASFGGNPHNEAMAHAHLSRLCRLLGDDAESEAQATAARELARRSGEVGYLDRIERALTIERWLDVET